jgi:uncharacterized protein YdeI (BOF family)
VVLGRFRITRLRAVIAGLSAVVLASAVTLVALYARADSDTRTTSAADNGDPAAATGIQPESSGSGSGSPSASGSASAGPSASTSKGAAAAGGVGRPPNGWPGPSNTGPGSTSLSTYSGPCTITAKNTVIEAKTVNCSLAIRATGVVIRKSKVNGNVDTDDAGKYSVTIEDSEVDGGQAARAAVAYTNVTVVRSNIHGGQTSVNCVLNCTIRDSWLHGQYMPPKADWHLDAFLMNGGSNATLTRNTLDCQNPDDGCSAAVGLFGDFAPVSKVTFDGNLFIANDNQSYCAYAGAGNAKPYQADNIVFRNNTFQRGKTGKCAFYGAITSFDPRASGNAWQNNTWDDGSALPSSN